MTEKPRVRVKAGQYAYDSYQNFEARLGVGTGNMMDGAGYGLSNLITRMPRQLEFMYRGSWIIGAAVDSVADDMTRAGVDFGAALKADAVEAMEEASNDIELWQSIGDVERWARLYGGAIGVMLIEGQDASTPLRPESIDKGQFRGVLALDRWSLFLDPTQALVGMGPNIGRPEFYHVGPNAPALAGKRIHHSRVIRREGLRLPFVQRQSEQGWGLSIVERMYDRLLAFDSASTGAAQLVFKAYLRTLKVEGLRQILSAGGPAEAALIKNVEAIRRFQSSEGLTLVDAKDDLQTDSYTFAGLDDILLQFGQQISGATEIPLVRLFGQSPAGLNSTGESDIRLYYDGLRAKQERHLRPGVNRLLKVLHRSVTGQDVPPGFTFDFNPLWQLSDKEKADIAKTTAEAVTGGYDAGLYGQKTALKELRQSAEVTGIFSNITDEEIEAASDEPPAPEGEGDDPPSAGDLLSGLTTDADFKEGDHPRRDDGKFGSSGGAAAGEPSEGPFGPVFTQFKHDAAGAVAHLKEVKSGEAVAALYHPDIGDIDLVWGEAGTGNSDGYGLAKLVEFHPEVVNKLQPILSEMTVTSRSKNRVQLESPDHKGAIRLDYDGQAKHWLLTAYKKDGAAGTTTDTASEVGGVARSPGATVNIAAIIEKFHRERAR